MLVNVRSVSPDVLIYYHPLDIYRRTHFSTCTFAVALTEYAALIPAVYQESKSI